VLCLFATGEVVTDLIPLDVATVLALRPGQHGKDVLETVQLSVRRLAHGDRCPHAGTELARVYAEHGVTEQQMLRALRDAGKACTHCWPPDVGP